MEGGRELDSQTDPSTQLKMQDPIQNPHRPTYDPQTTLKLLKRGASAAFFVQIVSAGLGLSAHLTVARLVGKAEYGIYALALTWTSTLAVVAQMGQDLSVIRFLPGYLAKGEWGKARGLRRGVGTLVFSSSTLIALAGCSIVHFMRRGHVAEWSTTFYVAFAMLPLITLLQQSSAVHRAFMRAVRASIYMNVTRPVYQMTTLLALYLFIRIQFTAVIAMTVSALAAAIALATSAWHLSRSWPVVHRNVVPRYEMRQWATIGLHLSISSVVIVAGNRIDVLLLGGLTGTSQVGAYYVASQLAGVSLYGLQAINVILAPLIAERFDVEDLASLELIAQRAARIGFLIAFAAGTFFAITGRRILTLFGKGFVDAYTPLLILLFGYIVAASFGEVGFMLSMTRYQKQLTYFALLGVAINAVGTWLLVPHLGATGAALGAVFALVTWRFCALRFVVNRLGVNPAIVKWRPLTGANR